MRKRFCNMFSESSTGSWAELQLPCCPSKQRELPENMLQNLLPNLPPQTVMLLLVKFNLILVAFDPRENTDLVSGIFRWSKIFGVLVTVRVPETPTCLGGECQNAVGMSHPLPSHIFVIPCRLGLNLFQSCCVYTVGRPVIRKVLKIRIWGVPRPAWAVGSYNSGPAAGGTPQILIFKT